MADPDMDEDLFADLYDGEADDPPPPAKAPTPEVKPEAEAEPTRAPAEPVQEEYDDQDVNVKTESDQPMAEVKQEQPARDDDYDRPLHIKEDGKMFIGGLNWETTDQSLKDYFSQFGDVLECTVMRDGATGRSRGFGFLTFKDPKTVNIVMVKEHQLDGKLIDPKRAIPREEQERTAKIFVGGVSQECTEWEFKEFFMGYGRVLDATLMMDKNTGRPRGFGFVTFDSDAAVDRTLEQPLAIHNKYVEIKRAEPRGNMRDEDGGGRGGFGGRGRGGFQGGNQGGFGGHQGGGGGGQMDQGGANGGGPNNMSASQMAQSWARMQQFYQMMQQQMAASQMANMQNNPMMMQQMMAQRGMNPAMMQQMQQMQQQQGGGGGGQGDGNGSGSPLNGGQGGGAGGFNAQEQLMFEQQKYEAQQQARMRQGSFQGGNTWEGMYDDVPAPANMRGGFGGGRGGRGGGGGPAAGPGGRNSQTPQPAPNAPAGAPTGPKNAGLPGANYRGGGRGGRRGYHPYARGGG